MEDERVKKKEVNEEPEDHFEQVEVMDIPLVKSEATKLERPPFLRSLGDHASRKGHYEGNELKKRD